MSGFGGKNFDFINLLLCLLMIWTFGLLYVLTYGIWMFFAGDCK